MGGFIHSYSQVGIGTETPTRMLDVNGNIRVTQLNDKTNTVDFEQLVAADANNNIDKVSKPSLIDDGTKQVEIVKNIYNSTTANNTKITSCGLLMFRLKEGGSGPVVEMRLRDAITSDLNLKYGGKRWGQISATTNNSYSYRNLTNTFTALNWNTYKNIDPSFILRQGAYLNYHFIIPGDGDLYRITVSRLNNDNTRSNYALICERFYKNN